MPDRLPIDVRPFRYRARLRRAAEIWGVPPLLAPPRARGAILVAPGGAREWVRIPARLLAGGAAQLGAAVRPAPRR